MRTVARSAAKRQAEGLHLNKGFQHGYHGVLNDSARVSLDRTRMQIDDRLVDLSPGMAVTVEIKTGSRTILSYLLSPLLRYQQDVLHER